MAVLELALMVVALGVVKLQNKKNLKILKRDWLVTAKSPFFRSLGENISLMYLIFLKCTYFYWCTYIYLCLIVPTFSKLCLLVPTFTMFLLLQMYIWTYFYLYLLLLMYLLFLKCTYLYLLLLVPTFSKLLRILNVPASAKQATFLLYSAHLIVKLHLVTCSNYQKHLLRI